MPPYPSWHPSSAVVNAATTAEMIIELIPTVDNKLANTLSILRVFRLLRLFRLSRQWKSLYVGAAHEQVHAQVRPTCKPP